MYELLQSITWYAVDVDQCVAAFDLGQMPTKALEVAAQWSTVDEIIQRLPEANEYDLLIKREEYGKEIRTPTRMSTRHDDILREVMWPTVVKSASDLPRRGIFQFWAEPAPYGTLPSNYRLACRPTVPVRLLELPETAQQVIAVVKAPLRFSDLPKIDVDAW